MKTLLFLTCCLALKAQVLTASLSSPFTYPSSSITLNLSFTDSIPPSGIVAAQWTYTLPAGFTQGTAVLGPGSTGKAITCTQSTGICLLTAPANSAPLTNGIVATVPFSAASSAALGSFTVGLSNPIASTQAGTNAPITFQTGVTSLSLPINVDASTGITPWFSVIAGKTTCNVTKVAQTPIRVSWVCFNPFGALDGYYTSNLLNGGNGTSTFLINLSSVQPVGSTATTGDALFCQIFMNASPQQLAFNVFPVNFQLAAGPLTVPPNSAGYICSAGSVVGPGLVSWP
jgi:hypothetical protein